VTPLTSSRGRRSDRSRHQRAEQSVRRKGD
jgi:hypothetical protein